MSSIIRDMIPGSIDDVIERWEQDESENYRLTLLHKNGKDLYCFLSGNMQEIEERNKIDMGMTLSFGKKTNIESYYDIIFRKNEIKDGYYFTFKHDDITEGGEKVIPFRFEEEMPSVIVDKNLMKKINDYLTKSCEIVLGELEYLGDHGTLRYFIYAKFDKERKERIELNNSLKISLGNTLNNLFRENKSPSSFIKPINYLERDKKKKSIFVKKNLMKHCLWVPSFVSLFPKSLIDHFFDVKIKDSYQDRFGQSKEEEAEVLMSDFAIGHPKVIKGVKIFIESTRHLGNTVNYSAQTSLTLLAYNYAEPIIHYPMIGGVALTGATMLSNLIKSKGRDSSGIISTLAERRFFNRLG